MWTVSYAQNTSMTLDNLPEQLQKNLEAAGLADLTVDQCEIIRRFLAGERTLVSGHDGAANSLRWSLVLLRKRLLLVVRWRQAACPKDFS